jgi:glycosyltransferase involved in cell wall biosynthesis
MFQFVSPILKKLELLFLDRNAVYVCNSQEVSARIARYWGIAASVVNPPVDIEFYRNYLQTEMPASLQLISAGRFVKYKNHDMAIEIASKLDCKLILAGSGPEEARLRDLAIQMGVDVDFVISPKRDELAELISKSTVFLHLAHEDFGILPIEAMSTGTPVVGFKVGGLCETVNAVNGRLSLNFEGLAESIAEAEMLNRLNVSASIARYSSEHFRREMQNLILSRWPEFKSRLAMERN